jgi:hypothetical protein
MDETLSWAKATGAALVAASITCVLFGGVLVAVLKDLAVSLHLLDLQNWRKLGRRLASAYSRDESS